MNFAVSNPTNRDHAYCLYLMLIKQAWHFATQEKGKEETPKKEKQGNNCECDVSVEFYISNKNIVRYFSIFGV